MEDKQRGPSPTPFPSSGPVPTEGKEEEEEVMDEQKKEPQEESSIHEAKEEEPKRNLHAIVATHPSSLDMTAFNDFFGNPAGWAMMRPPTPEKKEGEEGKSKKKMTSAQLARWEREQEVLKAEAEEKERLRLEELEREWNAPIIPRLEFSKTTRNKMPSISPRDKLSYQSDKKYTKEIEKYHEKSGQVHKFIVLLYAHILSVKPDNIADYLAEEYFVEPRMADLKKEFARQNESIGNINLEEERALAMKQMAEMSLGPAAGLPGLMGGLTGSTRIPVVAAVAASRSRAREAKEEDEEDEEEEEEEDD